MTVVIWEKIFFAILEISVGNTKVLISSYISQFLSYLQFG